MTFAWHFSKWVVNDKYAVSSFHFLVLSPILFEQNLNLLLLTTRFKVTFCFNLDSAPSQNKHHRSVSGTKSTEISSSERTKPDVAPEAFHGSSPHDNKSTVTVSTTSKATAVPTFKITLAGQVM